MYDIYNLKVLKNPMDFGVGFAAIAYKRKFSVLVVFDKNRNVMTCRKYRSLFLAMAAFRNLYARREKLQPEWSREKIRYFSGFCNALAIDGEGYKAWKKLAKIVET